MEGAPCHRAAMAAEQSDKALCSQRALGAFSLSVGKGSGHQQRDVEFGRSLWGFPSPISILPLTGEPTCSLVFFEECLPFLHFPQFPLSTLDLYRAPMLCLHTFMKAAKKAQLHLPLEVFLYHSHHFSARPAKLQQIKKGNKKERDRCRKKEQRDTN